MENNQELLAKAKEAKTPGELLSLAKENGIEMTDESAKAYFEITHPKAGDPSKCFFWENDYAGKIATALPDYETNI